MSESVKISRRRALSVLGLAAAVGLAASPTLLTVTDAEAQTNPPANPPANQPAFHQESAKPVPDEETRRTRRRKRRYGRRKYRHERREYRQKHRLERGEAQQPGSAEKPK